MQLPVICLVIVRQFAIQTQVVMLLLTILEQNYVYSTIEMY